MFDTLKTWLGHEELLLQGASGPGSRAYILSPFPESSCFGVGAFPGGSDGWSGLPGQGGPTFILITHTHFSIFPILYDPMVLCTLTVVLQTLIHNDICLLM